MSDNPASASLLVLYTERLDECLAFYTALGLPLRREQHGTGPVHHAAELGGGLVLELYPGGPGRTTDRLRLGFRVPASQSLPPGRHRLTDPDGRVVEVQAGPDGIEPVERHDPAVRPTAP